MCGVYVVLLFHVPGSRPFVYLSSSFSCIPQRSELAHLARPELVLWAVLLVTEFSSLPRNRRLGFSYLLRLFPQCEKLIIYSVVYMFSFFKGPLSCWMFSSGTGVTECPEGAGGGSLRRGCARRQPRTDQAGTQFQSPTQIDRVVGGWACARVLRFGATPVGRSYPMIRRAGGVCKADAQELSDDRRA